MSFKARIFYKSVTSRISQMGVFKFSFYDVIGWRPARLILGIQQMSHCPMLNKVTKSA